MKNECPEWAARIGVEVRHLTEEPRCEPNYIASLLRQIEASELATTPFRCAQQVGKIDNIAAHRSAVHPSSQVPLTFCNEFLIPAV